MRELVSPATCPVARIGEKKLLCPSKAAINAQRKHDVVDSAPGVRPVRLLRLIQAQECNQARRTEATRDVFQDKLVTGARVEQGKANGRADVAFGDDRC
ncbi:hypothetical protein BU23DRAFT_553567 [Bimuria novae-zelandiae CBS 107.79]|uniref:Uncharacterized protein n=1 Tax=Bimuria novae-zelandiae CBS 107.79 TaxID=1447943 RepID=A0A6A5VCU2_9PLEO|nr:hypothetical protein BU23DRAFT_553567 [Bimuria novae-zelandiae CBS 107.79]